MSQSKHWSSYKGAKIKSHSCEITRQHPKKVKTVPEPVYVAAQRLFAISVRNLCFKHRDLIQAHISSFTYLQVFVMSNTAFTKCGIETYTT